MYSNKKILCVIPAREGSKGIPNKNIIEVNGRPLIEYTIAAALDSKYIDKVIVSTDSEEISRVAQKNGAEVPFLRSEKLASDYSKIIDVLLDSIEQVSKIENERFDYIILLQPTQPLRKTFHIDEAIKKIINYNLESLLSVNLVEDHPFFIRTIDKLGRLKNLLDVDSTIRRQDLPQYYKVNGSIYINKINENFNNNTSLNDNLYPYIMDKKYDLDIDEPSDLDKLKKNIDLK